MSLRSTLDTSYTFGDDDSDDVTKTTQDEKYMQAMENGDRFISSQMPIYNTKGGSANGGAGPYESYPMDTKAPL